MQLLFGLDFTLYDWREAIDEFWENNPSRPGVKQYARKLVQGVMERIEELDEAIQQVTTNWSPDRVGRVERAVMRMAVYEMRYAPDVPDKVAINEAIEVLKRYGALEAVPFVNGVLDRVKETDPRRTES